MVEDRYDSCIEEHPGVPNRNEKSRLGGDQNLKSGEYRILPVLLRRPFGKLGGTAKLTFVPLCGEGFIII